MTLQLRHIPVLLYVMFSFIGYAQTNDKVSGNSCQPYFDYKKTAPINYSYNATSQTHDYSGNWDFDGDTDTDSLFFIGTGGAHLYFYLRIVLSSDKKVRDFTFLNLDKPCLGSINDLKNSSFYPPPVFPQFVVDDFYRGAIGDDTNHKIYLNLDNYSKMGEEWKKKGVTSNMLLLKYEKGEIIIEDFY